MKTLINSVVGIAQLARALDCDSRCRGFDSRCPPHFFLSPYTREDFLAMIAYCGHGYFYVLGCQRLRALVFLRIIMIYSFAYVSHRASVNPPK
jgi:hypothetical protein